MSKVKIHDLVEKENYSEYKRPDEDKMVLLVDDTSGEGDSKKIKARSLLNPLAELLTEFDADLEKTKAAVQELELNGGSGGGSGATADSTVYKFKGTATVATLEQIKDCSIGDIYNVVDDGYITINVEPTITCHQKENSSGAFYSKLPLAIGTKISFGIYADGYTAEKYISGIPITAIGEYDEDKGVEYMLPYDENVSYVTSDFKIDSFSIPVRTGDNVAWTGEVWDNLGSYIDLTPYATKENVKEQISALGEVFVYAGNIKSYESVNDFSDNYRNPGYVYSVNYDRVFSTNVDFTYNAKKDERDIVDGFITETTNLSSFSVYGWIEASETNSDGNYYMGINFVCMPYVPYLISHINDKSFSFTNIQFCWNVVTDTGTPIVKRFELSGDGTWTYYQYDTPLGSGNYTVYENSIAFGLDITPEFFSDVLGSQQSYEFSEIRYKATLSAKAGDNIVCTDVWIDKLSSSVNTSSFITKEEVEATYAKKSEVGSVYKFNGTLPVSFAEDIIADGRSLSVGTVYNVASKNGRFNGDEITMPSVVFSASQLLLCDLGGDGQYNYCGIEIRSPLEFLNSIDNYGIDTNTPIRVYMSSNGTEISGTFVAIEDGIVKFQTDTIPYEHIDGTILYATLTPTIKLYENDNIAWAGEYWDKLGSSFDTSLFVKKEDVNTQIDEEKEKLERLYYYGDMNIIPTDIEYFDYVIGQNNPFEDICCTIHSYIGTSSSVVIPYKVEGFEVKHIDTNAFKDNTKITKVILPKSVSIIREAFQNCTNLKQIVFNSEVSIRGSFQGCSNLKEIEFLDNTDLGSLAFDDCGFKNLVIPNKSHLGYSSLRACVNLEKIVFEKGSENPLNGAIINCFNLKEIVVLDDDLEINYDVYSESGAINNITFVFNQNSAMEACVKNATNSLGKFCGVMHYRYLNGQNKVLTSLEDVCSNILVDESNGIITDDSGTAIKNFTTEINLSQIILYDKQEAILGEIPTSIATTTTEEIATGTTTTEEKIRNEFALEVPANIYKDYESFISFPVGDTVPTIQYPAGIIFKGADCDGEGNFTPVANTNYEIALKYMGVDTDEIPIIVARVGSW